MTDIAKEYACCGCGACANACKQNAITMEYDEKGNMYPVTDLEKCTHCGMCDAVCAFRSDKELPSGEINVKKVYAAYANDAAVLRQTSSGGIAYLLTDHFLQENGSVYGCVQTTDGDVVHTKIENAKDACGSKYVQSIMGDCYRDICNDLRNGKRVLFIGVACQVAALKKYASVFLPGEKAKNLFTADVLCHGVPSRGVFFDYCKYLVRKNKSEIREIIFRDKKDGYQNCTKGNRVTFLNGCVDKLDLYYSLYFDHVILRPSCAACPYKNLHRDADISLSDFWNIGKFLPDFAYPNGVSRVLLNTPKGTEVFSCIKDSCTVCETTLENCFSVTQFNKPAELALEEHRAFYMEYVRSPMAAFRKYKIKIIFRKIKNRLWKKR